MKHLAGTLASLSLLATLQFAPIVVAQDTIIHAGRLIDGQSTEARTGVSIEIRGERIVAEFIDILATGSRQFARTFTGGVAKNEAAVKALRSLVTENYGEMTLNINPDSIYTGALGGATFAWRAVLEEGKTAEARA